MCQKFPKMVWTGLKFTQSYKCNNYLSEIIANYFKMATLRKIP